MSGGGIWQNTTRVVDRTRGLAGAVLRRLRPGALLRLGLATLIVGWLLFAATVLVLRYQVLPDIGRHRAAIEQMASEALGLPVQIGTVRAGWEGLRPELFLDQVKVLDRQGGEALSFRRVEAVLSWRSLAFLELRLHRLLAEGPTVQAERLADGRVFVAGLQVYPSTGGDPRLVDWVLHQDDIVVADARLSWRDALRSAAAGAVLDLAAVNFRLENRGRRHRFALLASPPDALAGRLDLRGDLRGNTLSRLSEWQGQFFAAVPRVDLAAWAPWFDAPVRIAEGRGGIRLWGRVDGFDVAELSADTALADLRVTLGDDLPELDLAAFQGRLTVRREGTAAGQAYHLTGLDLSLQLHDGLTVPPTGFHLEWTPLASAQGGGSEGLAFVSQLDLAHFIRLANYLPLDRGSRETLLAYAPQGEVKRLRLNWRGDAERLQRYGVAADFVDLGMSASGLLPGFEGLSGHLSVDQGKGGLEIASGPLALNFPAVFPEPRIVLDELKAKVDWTVRDGLLEVDLQEAAFSGPDATGSGRGRYRLALGDQGPRELQSPGEIDLTARLSEGDGTAVWRYLPHLIPADVRHWVRDAVRGGKVREADLVLRGPLAEFPFPRNERGQFLIKARVGEGRLLYAPDWPEVSELDTELRFEGDGVSFSAQQASTAGVRLGKVDARIANFSVDSPLLTIAGDAQGPVPGFLRFLDQSPLGEMLGRFYEDIRLTGDGKLKLGLEIPLDRPESARVKGEFEVAGGTVLIDPLLPPVTAFSGRVAFTEGGAHANALSGQFFGRPVRVDLRAEGNEVRVAAFGAATAAELQRQYRFPLLQALSGSMPFQAAVSVRDGKVGFAVESSLEGLQSSLPVPLRKSAESVLPVRFSRLPASEKTGRSGKEVPASRSSKLSAEAPRDQLRLTVGEIAGANLLRRLDPGRPVIERGIAALGEGWAAVPLPDKGLRVTVNQPMIDLDAWRAAWNAGVAAGAVLATGSAGTTNAGTTLSGVDWPTPQFDLKARTVRLIGREWHEVAVSAAPLKGGISGRLEARGMAGDWTWNNGGKGTLHARLKQLVLPELAASAAGNGGAAADAGEAPDDLPALDVVAERLLIGERQLGRLEVIAVNEAGRWRVPRFDLSSPDGRISGSGVWTPGSATTQPATLVDLAVEASDVGNLLGRFGYPNAVRRGEGKLSGRLAWQGGPTALHVPTLNGALDLRADRGQFNKLEPGIGKLLSLLSLQMLPRRITLDFRDVFSEGFAFEKIRGEAKVSNGVFATDNLVIEGPAATVLMKGDADLVRDRTQLHVTVQPELGSTVAIGAAVAVNPVIGVAALVAQKLFQDPLNKVFAFDYEVTGALSDPQVRKVSGPPIPGLSGADPVPAAPPATPAAPLPPAATPAVPPAGK